MSGNICTMIDARKNLVEDMKGQGKSENEIYDACRNLEYEEYITEIHNAEKAIEKYLQYYDTLEKDCPSDFKFLMLVNKWESPFVAINGLLKIIEDNEFLLKKKQKLTKDKINYKSRYKEMRNLVRSKVVWHG